MDEYSYDELFNDTGDLPLPQVPPVKGLAQRIDQLQTSACCQKLAWSKVGCIAYIDRTGRGVILRSLMAKPQDGSWILSNEQQVSNLPGTQLAHLSWNHSGQELAILDISGRISLYTMFIVLNDLRQTRNGMMDHEDDQAAIVGLYWLNSERQLTVYRGAVKEEGRWRYNMFNQKSIGPYHPIGGKSALVVVTKGGTVRLLFQLPDSRWHEARQDLDQLGNAQDRLTHASFCSDRGSVYLYLTTFSASNQLSLYAINIQWNFDPKDPSSAVNASPHLLINRVCTESCRRPQIDLSPGTEMLDPGQKVVSYPALTHLENIPVAPIPKQGTDNLPTIMAIFSDQTNHGSFQGQHPSVSVIRRWNIKPEKTDMHPCLETLSAGKSSSETVMKRRMALRSLEEVTIDKIIISISYVNHFSIVAFVFSDGSIELRDRTTLELFSPEEDASRISGMIQAGFTFPYGDPCIHAALSPNTCAVFGLNSDMDGSLRLIQPPSPSQTLSKADSSFTPLAITLSLHLSFSFRDHSNNDDLIAVMKQPLISNSALEQVCLDETFSALNVSIDSTFDAQLDKLVRQHMLRSFLSLQSSFGYKGDGSSSSKTSEVNSQATGRSLSSKAAWATLNLRMNALAFAYTFNIQKAGSQPQQVNAAQGAADVTNPEVFRSLTGAVKWFVDLSNLIVDDLFELSSLIITPSSPLTTETIDAAQQKLRSCSLSLVMTSAPRVLLRYNVKAIRSLPSMVGQAFSSSGGDAVGAQQNQAIRVLRSILGASAIDISRIDRFFADIDALIKSAYTTAQLTPDMRAAVEKTLMLTGRIPPVLVGVVDALLNRLLAELKKDINHEELFFMDFTWLGLSDEPASNTTAAACGNGKRKLQPVDILRKVPLRKGTALRRCTRCCAVMEDSTPPQAVMWLNHMQKSCVCGSLWMIVQQ